MLTPEIVAQLQKSKFVRTIPDQWKTDYLSPTVVRVESVEGSWIVKRSGDPRREVAVYRLFRTYGIPHFHIEPLGGDFLLYEDLKLPTLGSYLHETADLSPRLFFQLGGAGIQSELVGMKDRNLRNILIDPVAAKPYLIDFNAAFRTDLFNRMFRPYKFYRYLLRRMFFDVLRELSSLTRRRVDDLVPHFREGMLQEHKRINKLISSHPLELSLFTWPQRICLRTRATTQKRLTDLFEQGYASALAQEKTRV